MMRPPNPTERIGFRTTRRWRMVVSYPTRRLVSNPRGALTQGPETAVKRQVATLEEVLTYTLFGHAAKQSPSFANLGVRPFPKPELPSKPVSDAQSVLHAVWHFEHDAATDPARVRNLTCLSRGMGDGRMTVATSVTLEQAAVKTAPSADGKRPSEVIDLPLTPLFVIRTGYLKASSLRADSHFLYPLAAEIDLSMQVVFGYEISPDPSAGPLPIPKDQLSSADFMPAPRTRTSPSPPSARARRRKWWRAGCASSLASASSLPKSARTSSPGSCSAPAAFGLMC
jgi:hypothetical protein